MDVFDLYDRVDSYSPLDAIGDIVLNADDFVIFLQQEQLRLGKNESGDTIGTYTPYTEFISENYQEFGVEKPIQSKVAGEPYNFEWSGKYFKGMFIKVFANSTFIIEIDSSVPYADELEKRYKKLLGLADNNQDELNRFIEDKVTEQLNKLLNV